MFKSIYILGLASLALLPSCRLFGGGEEDYDTSDPYGTPNTDGYESAPYQDVNPPASNPTYGNAAYEATTPSPATLPAGPSIPSAVAGTHTVVKGDTLWGLSRKFGVSADAIRAVNGMAADDNNVRLGQTINIPTP
jgi:lipoprotein NlpD